MVRTGPSAVSTIFNVCGLPPISMSASRRTVPGSGIDSSLARPDDVAFIGAATCRRALEILRCARSRRFGLRWWPRWRRVRLLRRAWPCGSVSSGARGRAASGSSGGRTLAVSGSSTRGAPGPSAGGRVPGPSAAGRGPNARPPRPRALSAPRADAAGVEGAEALEGARGRGVWPAAGARRSSRAPAPRHPCADRARRGRRCGPREVELLAGDGAHAAIDTEAHRRAARDLRHHRTASAGGAGRGARAGAPASASGMDWRMRCRGVRGGPCGTEGWRGS